MLGTRRAERLQWLSTSYDTRLDRWRARRARRILRRAGDKGDRFAIDAVFWSWQRVPDDERWAQLARWLGGEVSLIEQVFRIGLSDLTDRYAGDSAGGSRLLEFLAARDLAPADPPDRALFYLLTRQLTQWRAADSGGSLAAAAYARAPEPARGVVRAVLCEAGDWAGLWPLVQDGPLAEAVRHVRRIGDEWRPPDERDRILFDLLARADPGQVADGQEAIAGRRDWFSIEDPVRASNDAVRIGSGAVSNWGRTVIVVRTEDEDESPRWQSDRPWLERGGSTRLYFDDVLPGATAGGTSVTYMVGTLVVSDGLSRGADGTLSGSLRLARECSWGHRRFEAFPHLRVDGQRNVTGFCPLPEEPGGFALMSAREASGLEVTLHDRDGRRLAGLDLAPALQAAGDARLRASQSGMLGVWHGGGFAVYDILEPARPRLLGLGTPAGLPDGSPGRITGLCFPGPGRVASMEASEVRVWQATGAGLEVVAANEDVTWPYAPYGVASPYRLETAPGSGAMAIIGPAGATFLDARSLAGIQRPDWVPSTELPFMGGSLDGTWWLICDMYAKDPRACAFRAPHLATALADRGIAGWVPEDKRRLADAIEDRALPPAARPLGELLRDCLEWRFATA